MTYVCDPSPVLELLKVCPAYQVTPIVGSSKLASQYGWQSLMIKDETNRMEMGSFKALGGVYAVAKLLSDNFNQAKARYPLVEELIRDEAKKLASAQTFICASAGNHGLSVSTGARLFGAKAIVYVAQTVPDNFIERLQNTSATVVRKGAVYDDAMAAAMRDAQLNNWTLVSDSSWEGYCDIPSTIMQGYGVIAYELQLSFENTSIWPTHVFLQAGVGGFAAGITAYIRKYWSEQPQIIIVEPDKAPCIEASIKAGELLKVEGEVSNMGRLDCKEPSLIALEILRESASHFMTISDEDAKQAVDTLAIEGIMTTPSGAAGFAGAVLADLPKSARVLIIATEGCE